MLYPLAHVAAAAVGLAVYVLATHHGRQRRHPSAAIAWVVATVAFPYVAIPLFLFFGSRRFVRPSYARQPISDAQASSQAPLWAIRLSAGLFLPPPRENIRIDLLDEGPRALEALIQVIERAQHRLDLCTFVFADDEAGRRVASALIACAGRGCRVRILLDAVGGLRMSRDLRRLLASSGIDTRRFMPLIHDPRRGRGNLRNHRKLVIADDCCMWSGGSNIANEYFLDRPGRPAWLDLNFVVEGALAGDAARTFEQDWRLAGGILGTASPWAIAGEVTASCATAQLIPSGPDQSVDTVYSFLLTAMYQAQTRILAASPYFVPDEALLQALSIASRRGVRVSLLVPEHSNHRLADWARERDLRELAAAGAHIRLLPGMLHAKLVIVDEAVALCGSVNLDGRSLFLNYELFTAFYRHEEVERFARWHERTMRMASDYVARPPSLPRDVFEGLVRTVGFQL